MTHKRMNESQSSILYLALLLAVFSLSSQTAVAQSTIATVPSTDVVSEKSIYLEFDFTSHFANQRDGGFKSYTPRAVVGIGHNVEVGANVIYTNGFGVAQPLEIQPNVKWRFYQNESTGIAANVGAIVYAPITHRAGTDTFVLVYTIVSKKVSGRYGPRVTGGGYALVARAEGTGSRAGAIVGYEQPLAHRVSFVADWFSGKNRFGYVTPGFSFATTQHSNLYTGYSIGNQGRRNNALFAYYGITF